MALSQDEQRMLAEIERRLAADDPGLASCLTTFRRPGPGTVLRSPRARIIGSLFTVLLVAMVSLMVYAMVPFRGTHGLRHAPPQTSSAPVNTAAISAPTSSEPNRTQQSSASVSTSAESTTSQSAQSHSATATATGKAQQPKVQPPNIALLPSP
jgi:cytoskeletal protein RodZ